MSPGAAGERNQGSGSLRHRYGQHEVSCLFIHAQPENMTLQYSQLLI